MITSASNPKIKRLVQLMKKGRSRREAGCFVTEGIRMVLEAPADRLAEVYISETFSKNQADASAARRAAKAAGCQVEILPDKLFKEISDTQTPQGIMAVVRFNGRTWRQIIDQGVKRNGVFLILESLQDPGNLGTILRTGEGAGVDGVILNKTSVDPYMPKAVRSTMGALYRVPIAIAEDLHEVTAYMKSKNIKVCAAHLKGKKNFFEADLGGACCFMIGNEGAGLTDEIAADASEYLLIPMEGQVESLNAGVAASLMMYEAKRQRMMV